MKAIALLFAGIGLIGYNIWVLWLDQADLLPNPLATHWGFDGQADGFASVSEHLSWSNFAMLLVTGLIVFAAFLPGIHQSLRRILFFFLSYLGLFFYGLMIYIIAAQIGKPNSSEVRIGAELLWFVLPVLLIAPMVLTMPRVSLSDKLRIQLWGLSVVTLEYPQIASVSKREVKPSQFGGWGLRFIKGTVAFIPNKGPALEIKTINGEVILVRSNQVDNLLAAITPKL